MKEHPKASTPGFWNDDYKETKRYEEGGYLIIHYENSAGREKVEELPLSGGLPNVHFPGGGCNRVGGTLFCSFNHIDWQVPQKQPSQQELNAFRDDFKAKMRTLGLE
jgi:hypothetical protein